MKSDDYLRRVDAALSDLPWSVRRDLMAELKGHLQELPTDEASRLGTPEEYAAEMRTAAGLERRRGPIAFLRARRPRNLILMVVLLTVTGLAIGAVAWIDSYQPIGFAGGTELPLDAKGSVGQAGYTVVFRKGHPFQYGISIWNNGRYPVRVLGVPRSVTDFYSGRLLMSEPSKQGDSRPLKRFHPFDLKPGETGWLLYKGVYACTTGMGEGGLLTWTALPVRFRFLWRTATASIPLGEPLTFNFRNGCPPPKHRPATP